MILPRRRRGTKKKLEEDLIAKGYGNHVSNVEETPGMQTKETPDASNGLPRRRELHRRKKSVSFKSALSSLLLRVRSSLDSLVKYLRDVHVAGKAALFAYIPIRLFVCMTFFTIGLYPYVWFWENIPAFMKIGQGQVGEKTFKRFAVTGFCIQLLFIFAAASSVWTWFTGSVVHYEFSIRVFAVYCVLYAFIVLPQRSFLYFDLRWSLRKAVIAWDRSGIVIDRTMTSWWKLFLLGPCYLQYHINRLMGLGMPGLSDSDEIVDDITLSEWVREYIKKPEREIRWLKRNG